MPETEPFAGSVSVCVGEEKGLLPFRFVSCIDIHKIGRADNLAVKQTLLLVAIRQTELLECLGATTECSVFGDEAELACNGKSCDGDDA